jgi:hypothetical protein
VASAAHYMRAVMEYIIGRSSTVYTILIVLRCSSQALHTLHFRLIKVVIAPAEPVSVHYAYMYMCCTMLDLEVRFMQDACTRETFSSAVGQNGIAQSALHVAC